MVIGIYNATGAAAAVAADDNDDDDVLDDCESQRKTLADDD